MSPDFYLMRDAIFPTRERESGHLERKALDKDHFPFLAWEKSHLARGRKPSGPKKQPKHKVFGQDIPGTSRTQTSGYPGQKLYAGGLFLLF